MSSLTLASAPAEPHPALCLRRDLRSSLHECRGERFFLIEDPAREAFYRLGLVEWQFAARLDGKTPLPQAYAEMCAELGQDVLPPEKARHVCQWLDRNGLLKTAATAAVHQAPAPVAKGPMLMLSAFFFRIPLFRPDSWLDRVQPYTRWVFTIPALLAWLVLVLAGASTIFQHWDQFRLSTRIYASPHMWLYLGIVWIALKFVHELFHGLACKHFGGRVGSSGIAFILFAPVAFVDVTSAWAFRSKWHRIWTSAAGMYVEFACAAVAAMVWATTSNVVVQSICHSVVMAASVTTILFNGNPLMRFDGYYILTDLLEIQNLYAISREHVRRVVAKWFLGLPATATAPGGRTGWFIRGYGWASAAWRILVCASMTLAAATLFHGAGILLAAVASVAWFAKPIADLVRNLMTLQKTNKAAVARCLVLSIVVITVVTTVALLPFPGGVAAPAIVDFEPLHFVRAEATGFVDDIRVRAGQNVTAGQILMSIHNDELETELKQVQAECRQADIRARILHHENDLAGYQAAQERAAALSEHKNSLHNQVLGLTVRAPSDGKIVTRKPLALAGQYVELGTLLVILGDEQAKAVLTSIPEEYVESFEKRVGTRAHVWVRGGRRQIDDATLTSVEPSASDALRHEALGSHTGGPIPVRNSSLEQEPDASNAQFRMVAPRFYGIVKLTPEQSASLMAGQLAEVRFTDWSESVGKKLYRVVTAWVCSKLGRNG